MISATQQHTGAQPVVQAGVQPTQGRTRFQTEQPTLAKPRGSRSRQIPVEFDGLSKSFLDTALNSRGTCALVAPIIKRAVVAFYRGTGKGIEGIDSIHCSECFLGHTGLKGESVSVSYSHDRQKQSGRYISISVASYGSSAAGFGEIYVTGDRTVWFDYLTPSTDELGDYLQ